MFICLVNIIKGNMYINKFLKKSFKYFFILIFYIRVFFIIILKIKKSVFKCDDEYNGRIFFFFKWEEVNRIKDLIIIIIRIIIIIFNRFFF